MKHLFEYESWSDYKTPEELKSRIKYEGRKRAEDFFKKKLKGEEVSDMFNDDEEFKQDMKEIFFEHGCGTPSQLDFLLSLDFSKEDLRTILDKNTETLDAIKSLQEKFPEKYDIYKNYVNNFTRVNQTLEDMIG